MATRFHWAKFRASCHGTEDPAKVEQALRFVAGDEAELRTSQLESHYGGLVQLLEATLDKSRAARAVLERFLALPGAHAALASTAESRMDDEGVFYLRADKQAAFQGRLELTGGEDCVQVRIKPEAYPATRAKALEAILEFLAQSDPPRPPGRED